MGPDFKSILEDFEEKTKKVNDIRSFKSLRDEYLSKDKGILSNLMKKIREIPKEERPEFGKNVNLLKNKIVHLLEELKNDVEAREIEKRAQSESVDITLPGIDFPIGSFHPVKIVEKEICDIFERMGYFIAEGPEIENDFNNFEALNFPDDHPARDSQDTFFISEDKNYLLRTHTSPVQIRTLKKYGVPIKIIAPGKVFRRDTPDPTHSPIFHQIEGLVVDTNITMADLKGTLEKFARECFSEDTKIRLRPSFFPFVEPGAEVDISCIFCKGTGCRICKNSGWIEILGAGMVHPAVFEKCGIDSEKYSGFAFGLGVDRIAILRYGIPDIRLFFENDIRFLKQF